MKQRAQYFGCRLGKTFDAIANESVSHQYASSDFYFPANSVSFSKLLYNIRQFGHGWPDGNDEHDENGRSGYLGYITIQNHLHGGQ